MATPPSSQDDRFYHPEKLKKVFALSAIAMMVVTVWMVLDDFGREWKGYQRQFLEIKERKAAKQAEDAKSAIDAKAIAEVEAEWKAAEKEIAAHSKEIERLTKHLTDLKTKRKNLTVAFQALKAEWDVQRFHYESHWGHLEVEGHLKEGSPKQKKEHEQLLKDSEKVQKASDVANLASLAADAKQKEYDERFAKRIEAENKVKELKAAYDKALAAKDASRFDLKKLVRSSPVLDLADPVFRIKQIVLPHLRDDIFFSQVGKVDRCATCHQAIDTPGFEDQPNPFKTHPRLDVMLGSRSPHPIDKIGCTICHDGRGPAVDFVRAAHTPRNEEQKTEWSRKYGWNEHDQHHIMEKMAPLQYTQGKCRVCHREQEYVYRAPKLTAGVQMIRAAGCYGCHKIEGWENVDKPAPSLLKAKGKLTRDWILKWIRDPRSFNEWSRMPASFLQDNTKDHPVYRDYQHAEMHGIADYLLASSEAYKPWARMSGGSRERGKETFKSVGCLGCHQIEDFGHKAGRWGRAPDLSTVGSKVSKDWLVSWIKNPAHYRADTTMPNLRLSDGEANDIAAYLLSKRNPDFEAKIIPAVDGETQKKVLRLYLLRDPKLAPATESRVAEEIGKLDSRALSVELGRRAIGQYGCFGCHEIKGFAGVSGIGPELSEEWSKPITKFDFGLQHFDHTKIAWFHKKLQNPRLFDEGLVKDYLDLLRMPNFNFLQDDQEPIVTALVGMTAEKPQPKVLTARQRKLEQNRQVIHKYNCQGCHMMENLWEPLPDGHPDYEKNEANKWRLEARILYQFEEDESIGPPKILSEGFRVQTDWAHGFLRHPEEWKMRQSLKVRMPTFNFTWEERNRLLDGWGNESADAAYPMVDNKPVQLSARQQADAKVLFTKLMCMNCHNLGEKLTADQLEGGSKGFAPNLRFAAKRLRREWMVAFLKNPAQLVPGTRMPGFWMDGAKPVSDVLGGDSEKQIQLLVDYVISLGQTSTPKAE